MLWSKKPGFYDNFWLVAKVNLRNPVSGVESGGIRQDWQGDRGTVAYRTRLLVVGCWLLVVGCSKNNHQDFPNHYVCILQYVCCRYQDEIHHNRTGTSNGSNFPGSIIYSILITGYKAIDIPLVVNIPRPWVISDVAEAALYCC